MKLSDLQFENGVLVKIEHARPEYLNGYEAIKAIKELGALVDSLRHQLVEVTGTYAEYSAMPCTSTLVRHYQAVDRAAEKLEELK